MGAVLVKDDRVISVGYNGMPSGMDNECEDIVKKYQTVPTNRMSLLTHMPIHETKEYEELVTKPGLVHAEMNVIAFASKYGVSTNQCIMIITHSPCFECSKLIVQSGIKKVYYETEYRLTEGLDFLRECGVEVEKLDGRESKETRETKAT